MVLMRTLNEKIVDAYLVKANQASSYTDSENERIRYSLRVIISEIEKVAIIATLMVLQNYFWIFLCSFLVVFSCKQFMGGTHRKTFLGCLLFSLFFFQTVIVLATHIEMKYSMFLWIGYVCLILLNVPLQYGQIKISERNAKQKCKMKSLLCLLFWCAVIFFVSNIIFEQTILWTLCIQLLEILRVEGRKNIWRIINGLEE